jgi:hypothetical protein
VSECEFERERLGPFLGVGFLLVFWGYSLGGDSGRVGGLSDRSKGMGVSTTRGC